MESVKQFFTQKVGPLPTWAWGGIAAGIIVAGILFYRHRVANAPATSPASAAPSMTGISDVPVNEPITGLPPSPVTVPSFFGVTEDQPPGFPTSGYGTIPLYANPTDAHASILGWLPWSSQIQITGPARQGRASGSGITTWYPVQWGGITGWLNGEAFQSFIGSPDANTTATGTGGGNGRTLIGNSRAAGRRRTHKATIHETPQ